MANVLLLSVAEEDPRDNSFNRGAYLKLKQSADLGTSRHTLVDDPAQADIILFAELIDLTFAYAVQRHPYYKAYRSKCFAFAIGDHVIPFVPGVYPSIEKSWYSPQRVRSGFYLSISENSFMEYDPTPVERDLLYSFVGSVITAPVRASLSRLSHPRGYFVDTSDHSLPILAAGSPEQRAAFYKRYSDIARRSKFVLCPRGEGTSSIRLFETMQAGRAPVILADQWVPPLGPKWDEFSIRIPENHAAIAPQILEKREDEAVAMGLKAREEWERWFSPNARFNTVIDWCLEIKEARRLPEFLATLTVYPQILRPFFLRAYIRLWKYYFKDKFSPANRTALPA
jgi:hypothetical protein